MCDKNVDLGIESKKIRWSYKKEMHWKGNVEDLQNLFYFGKCLLMQKDGDSLKVQANHTNYMCYKCHQWLQNMLHLLANLSMQWGFTLLHIQVTCHISHAGFIYTRISLIAYRRISYLQHQDLFGNFQAVFWDAPHLKWVSLQPKQKKEDEHQI